MGVGFGKYQNKSAAEILLAHPDYVAWLFSQAGLSGAAAAFRRALHDDLIPAFDARPVRLTCAACGTSAATQVTPAPAGRLRWWCGACAPADAAAPTYATMLRFGAASAKKADFRRIVLVCARAKGLAEGPLEVAAEAFLRGGALR